MTNNIINMSYPVSCNIYYRTFRNITTLSKEGRLFKQKVKLNHLHIKPSDDYVVLDITIHPKQKKDGSAFDRVIDLDNGLKCVLDSLIGVVYQDDRQVKKLKVTYGLPKVGGATTVIVSKFVAEDKNERFNK